VLRRQRLGHRRLTERGAYAGDGQSRQGGAALEESPPVAQCRAHRASPLACRCAGRLPRPILAPDPPPVNSHNGHFMGSTPVALLDGLVGLASSRLRESGPHGTTFARVGAARPISRRAITIRTLLVSLVHGPDENGSKKGSADELVGERPLS